MTQFTRSMLHPWREGNLVTIDHVAELLWKDDSLCLCSNSTKLHEKGLFVEDDIEE
jgi:hypothetical protein